MANPQTENGYTKIANEVLEALSRIRIPGEAMQIFLVIIRKTYGFQKKEDAIALSQFCLATGINKPNVFRAIKQLQIMNLIIKNDNANPQTYRFNKDYSQWKPLSKKITLSKKIINVIENDNESLSKKITTKEIKKKEITTTSRSKISFNHETGKFVNLDGNIEKWQTAYKGIDILSELQRMECWIKANPGRSKTNWERFVVNWLSKAYKETVGGKHIPQRHTGVVV